MKLKWKVCVLIVMVAWFAEMTAAGKDKQRKKKGGKEVKKRPVAVTDPTGLRSKEDWLNLGTQVLTLSCEAADIPTGTLVEMANRLHGFYQDMTNNQGKRVSNFFLSTIGVRWPKNSGVQVIIKLNHNAALYHSF